MRPSATACAQRAVAGTPPNEKKWALTCDGAASARRADEIVGNGQREHLPQHPGALRQRLRRGAHAAAAGVAQQRRDAGRADEPDAQRLLETETAQPRHVIEDRARVETELGDDLDRKPGRLGRRDLFRERLEQRVVADVRMAFRIAGDADRANAAAAEQAGIDGVGGAAERAVFAAVAGDDQNAPHLGLAVQAAPENHRARRRWRNCAPRRAAPARARPRAAGSRRSTDSSAARCGTALT